MVSRNYTNASAMLGFSVSVVVHGTRRVTRASACLSYARPVFMRVLFLKIAGRRRVYEAL